MNALGGSSSQNEYESLLQNFSGGKFYDNDKSAADARTELEKAQGFAYAVGKSPLKMRDGTTRYWVLIKGEKNQDKLTNFEGNIEKLKSEFTKVHPSYNPSTVPHGIADHPVSVLSSSRPASSSSPATALAPEADSLNEPVPPPGAAPPAPASSPKQGAQAPKIMAPPPPSSSPLPYSLLPTQQPLPPPASSVPLIPVAQPVAPPVSAVSPTPNASVPAASPSGPKVGVPPLSSLQEAMQERHIVDMYKKYIEEYITQGKEIPEISNIDPKVSKKLMEQALHEYGAAIIKKNNNIEQLNDFLNKCKPPSALINNLLEMAVSRLNGKAVDILLGALNNLKMNMEESILNEVMIDVLDEMARRQVLNAINSPQPLDQIDRHVNILKKLTADQPSLDTKILIKSINYAIAYSISKEYLSKFSLLPSADIHDCLTNLQELLHNFSKPISEPIVIPDGPNKALIEHYLAH